MGTPRPRVLIADDHLLIAQLCKNLLEPEFDVVGVVGNGRELVRAVEKLKPHVAVIDIAMPILNGIDAGRQMNKLAPSVKLIYLTMTRDEYLAAELMRGGASGFLLKTCAASELVVAVHAALQGETYLSPEIATELVDAYRWNGKGRQNGRPLTQREREVLQLLAEGRLMKEVANVLNLTTRTVIFHKQRIMDALGAGSDADLVRYAVREHLVDWSTRSPEPTSQNPQSLHNHFGSGGRGFLV